MSLEIFRFQLTKQSRKIKDVVHFFCNTPFFSKVWHHKMSYSLEDSAFVGDIKLVRYAETITLFCVQPMVKDIYHVPICCFYNIIMV